MIRLPPRSTRTDTLFPYTTLFRSAVIVGNGNVALDVARILVSDPEALAKTDIADHALAQLRSSKAREVVVLGRRGPLEAAFTTQELIGLSQTPGADLLLRPDELSVNRLSRAQEGDPDSSVALYKLSLLEEFGTHPPVQDRQIG